MSFNYEVLCTTILVFMDERAPRRKYLNYSCYNVLFVIVGIIEDSVTLETVLSYFTGADTLPPLGQFQ